MKTKAYKLRENIGRYIYKRLKNKDIDTEIFWDKSDGAFTIFTKDNLISKCHGEIQSMEYHLGIDIRITIFNPAPYDSKLWNKEKEEKYLERQNTFKNVYLRSLYKTLITFEEERKK